MRPTHPGPLPAPVVQGDLQVDNFGCQGPDCMSTPKSTASLLERDSSSANYVLARRTQRAAGSFPSSTNPATTPVTSAGDLF